MAKSRRKIEQIMPAVGVNAVYGREQDVEEIQFGDVPLVCWALVQELSALSGDMGQTETRKVVGMILPHGEVALAFADEYESSVWEFVGYHYDGEIIGADRGDLAGSSPARPLNRDRVDD